MQPNSIGSEDLATPTYPGVGDVFELALNGDARENQPLEMVDSFGYNPEGWCHKGPTISGHQTRRFKLVQVGYCSNLDKVKEKTSALGENPAGQWINAFHSTYPKSDGQGPIGIADGSWVGPNGRANFPYVLAVGFLHFNIAGHIRGEDWRWLVAVT
jgi:hypothetical protein